MELARRDISPLSAFHVALNQKDRALQPYLQMRVALHVDGVALCDIARIEPSSMPEARKASKNSAVRLCRAQFRLRRRRIVLDGIYEEGGQLIIDPRAAGEAIRQHWQPIYT